MTALARAAAALTVVAVVAANIVTAAHPPAVIGGLIVPAGTFLIGATFLLRDVVHAAYGRRVAYTLVIAAAAASGAASVYVDGVAVIALAGALATLIGEAADTEVFARVRGLPARVALSGAVGGTLDSVIFVVVGLSPLGAGILPWALVPAAVAGQTLAKGAMQAVAALALIPRRAPA